MEKSFVVRSLDPWWKDKGKCIVPIDQQTIKDLGWKFGEAVEIKVEGDKIVIKKLDNVK